MPNPKSSIFPSAIVQEVDIPILKDQGKAALLSSVDNSTTDFSFTDANLNFILPCLIAIEDEIILAQGPFSGTTISNCTRGYLGTTAASHLIGKIGYGYLHADHINQIHAEIRAIETALGISLANVIKTNQSAGGDLSNSYPNPTVATVGGATAVNIADASAKRHVQNTDTGTSNNSFKVGTTGPSIVTNSSTEATVVAHSGAENADLNTRDLKTTRNIKAAGTVEVGSSGPLLKKVDGNTLEVRTNSDTDNANVIGKNVTATGQVIVGSSGPRLKQVSSSHVELRNSLDNDHADLTVKNLNVVGTTTTIQSENVEIADNIITLNSNVTSGSPSENAGIEVNRGASPKASILWDESNDVWKFGIAGSEQTVVRQTDAAGGDLSGFFPNPSVSLVGGAAAANVADAANKRHSQNTDTGTTNSTFEVNSAGANKVKIVNTGININDNVGALVENGFGVFVKQDVTPGNDASLVWNFANGSWAAGLRGATKSRVLLERTAGTFRNFAWQTLTLVSGGSGTIKWRYLPHDMAIVSVNISGTMPAFSQTLTLVNGLPSQVVDGSIQPLSLYVPYGLTTECRLNFSGGSLSMSLEGVASSSGEPYQINYAFTYSVA